LSYDYSREQQLAACAALAKTISGRHQSEIDRALRAMAATYGYDRELRRESTAVLWTAYLSAITEHLSSILGRDATTGVLRQVLQSHLGDGT
jgi:hypothetical protein